MKDTEDSKENPEQMEEQEQKLEVKVSIAGTALVMDSIFNGVGAMHLQHYPDQPPPDWPNKQARY